MTTGLITEKNNFSYAILDTTKFNTSNNSTNILDNGILFCEIQQNQRYILDNRTAPVIYFHALRESR